MFVFVAHTDVDKDFAFEAVDKIRAAGHEAVAGEQIYRGFTSMSFGNPDIVKALRAADVLVAFGLDWMWHKYVAAEVAFFSGHTTLDKTILVTTHDLDERTPPYLLLRRVIYFDGSRDKVIREILAHIAALKVLHGRSSQQIFLSYSRANAQQSIDIHDFLIKHGYEVWFDQKSLIAGQIWDVEIEKAITKSRVFLPIISSGAISKRGFFQKELKRSFDIAEEVPESTVFIIPVLIDKECSQMLPQALKKYHWILWQDPDGGGQLEKALDFALEIDRPKTDRRDMYLTGLVRNPLRPWEG